jgi:predicted dehydrogenase
MKKVRYAVVGAGWISQEDFILSIDQTGKVKETICATLRFFRL